MASIKIKDLDAAQIQQERERFPRVFSLTPKDRAVRVVLWGGGAILLLYSMWRFGFFSEKFYGSLGRLMVMFGQMFPPTGWGQMGDFADAILETLAMAFVGSLIGGILAVPLGFLAAKNMNRIRPLQFGVRRFADVLRAADYLIWGLIFVRAIGLGPLPGIMAIAIVDTGILIVLYSDALENIDRKQIDGIRAAGGNALQVIGFGVLPQVMPVLLTNALYMFESNTRAATILGIVGAGGIGFLLSDNLRAFEFSNACSIILMIIVLVYFIDFFSRLLRERFIRGDAQSQGTTTGQDF